eukprot:jgi/Botrbrau1/17302/Bobra.0015s0056.5
MKCCKMRWKSVCLNGSTFDDRYDDTADASSARLWVKYQSGLEAPLEPRVGVGHLAALGYNSCTPFDYIERDLKSLRMDIEKRHQYRYMLPHILGSLFALYAYSWKPCTQSAKFNNMQCPQHSNKRKPGW